jgi:ribosomal protein L23
MRRNAMIRGQDRGVSARWKKAVVTLRPGDSLAVFES